MESTVQSIEKMFNAKKFIVWLLIVSSIMAFAGLVSAFIVMRYDDQRVWTSVKLPQVFLLSTLVVFMSSVVIHLGYNAFKKKEISKSRISLFITLALGFVFGGLQFKGLFVDFFNARYYFFGSSSTVSSTFVYLFACFHMFHLLITMLVVIVLLIKSFNQKQYERNIITFHNSVVFWHFLGVLWVFLYLFLYIYR